MISECLFAIFNSPKKPTKKFDFTNRIPQVEFVRFLGRVEDIKKTFRNWLTLIEKISWKDKIIQNMNDSSKRTLTHYVRSIAFVTKTCWLITAAGTIFPSFFPFLKHLFRKSNDLKMGPNPTWTCSVIFMKLYFFVTSVNKNQLPNTMSAEVLFCCQSLKREDSLASSLPTLWYQQKTLVDIW